jgi:hypothetical protein
MSGFGGS